MLVVGVVVLIPWSSCWRCWYHSCAVQTALDRDDCPADTLAAKQVRSLDETVKCLVFFARWIADSVRQCVPDMCPQWVVIEMNFARMGCLPPCEQLQQLVFPQVWVCDRVAVLVEGV